MSMKAVKADGQPSSTASRRAFLHQGVGFASLGVIGAACGVPQSGTLVDKTAQPVTMRYAIYNNVEQAEVWKEVAEAFHAKYPRLTLELENYPGENFFKKIETLLISDELPDLIEFETKQLPSFAKRGAFLDIEPYTKKSKITKRGEIFPQDWDKNVIDGKLYGLPWDDAPSVIYYNKAVFDKAGVKYPPAKFNDPNWTWDTFRDVAKRLTSGDGDNKTYGFAQSTWWVYLLPWIWSNGGRVLSKDLTKFVGQEPATVNAVQWIVELGTRDGSLPKPGELQGGNNQGLRNGRVAMVATNVASIGFFRQFEDLAWDIAPYPTGRNGAWTRNPTDSVCVARTTKVPDECFQAVEYIVSDAGMTILAKQGRVPTRTSVAFGDAYLKQQPPINWRVAAESAKDHAKLQPVTDQWPEMDRLFGEHARDLWSGAETPRQMMEVLRPQIDTLLAQATYRRVPAELG